MAGKQPDNLDLLIGHAIVGVAAAGLLGRKAGVAGMVISAVGAIFAHQAFDAPVAQIVADLR